MNTSRYTLQDLADSAGKTITIPSSPIGIIRYLEISSIMTGSLFQRYIDQLKRQFVSVGVKTIRSGSGFSHNELERLLLHRQAFNGYAFSISNE